MEKNVTNTAGKHQCPRIQRRKVGRRRDWERTLGRKTISFSVQKPVFNYLKAAAESQKLLLPAFVRNAVFEWVTNNLHVKEPVPTCEAARTESEVR